MKIIRPLNSIEEALTLSNEIQPLSTVIVLHLSPCPTHANLTTAIERLQKNHILLRCFIGKSGNKLHFIESDPAPVVPIMFHTVQENLTWETLTERKLNTKYPRDEALFQIDCFKDTDSEKGELILTYHHALMDSESARWVLHELLALLSGDSLDEKQNDNSKIPARISLKPFPFLKTLIPYLKSQIKEEVLYQRNGFSKSPPSSSTNKVLTLRFDQNFSNQLQQRCNELRLNLNNVILSAMTKALLEHKYQQKKGGLVRVINFASVRSSLPSDVHLSALGCYISMLRIGIHIRTQEDTSIIAKKIRKALREARRKDQIRLMAWMSKYLVPVMLTYTKMRLGQTALSFMGNLPLQQAYGKIKLEDVNAFISNNQSGPEFSAFGKVLHGRLGLDFNYLTAETSDEEARRIVSSTESYLRHLV